MILISYDSKSQQIYSSLSQSPMQVVDQCSAQNSKTFETLPCLKPWHFKPKRSLFVLEDHQCLQKKKFNKLHWSQDQNLRYAQFLQNFIDLVQSKVAQKRRFHLNRIMSKHIKTRSPRQCRSHHQKMLKSYKSVSAIIEHFLQSSKTHSQQEGETSKARKGDMLVQGVEESRASSFFNQEEGKSEREMGHVGPVYALEGRQQEFDLDGDDMFFDDNCSFPQVDSWSF